MKPWQSKSTTKRWQKKDLRTHVLLKADMYVGSLSAVTETLFVPNDDGSRLVQRDITYVPALLKICDEILVNAADVRLRDESMTQLKVSVDEAKGSITVWNNGSTLPCVMHEEEKMLVPELVFSQFLCGEHFDEDSTDEQGGTYGYGAKLTNTYSTKFIVECNDVSTADKRFRQEYKDNMAARLPPVLTAAKGKSDYTRVTFFPDWSKFGMKGLDADTLLLIKKRVYDMAGVFDKTLKVYFNGSRLPFAGFKAYAALHFPADLDKACAYQKISDQCEVVVGPVQKSDDSKDRTVQQASFVNSVWTIDGGQHVKNVVEPLAKFLVDTSKKNASTKDLGITAAHVKR
jgi:DNA topoisomerase-2